MLLYKNWEKLSLLLIKLLLAMRFSLSYFLMRVARIGSERICILALTFLVGPILDSAHASLSDVLCGL